MDFDELSLRYGPYVAERVRQGLTLRAFQEMEREELITYFELLAERSYEEYRSRVDAPTPEEAPLDNPKDYLDVLRRRWQEAEELAALVLQAEREASNAELRAMES